jgi:hypothetical protein
MYVLLKICVDTKLIPHSASISQTARPLLVPFLLSMQSKTLVSDGWLLSNIRPITSDETLAPHLVKGKSKVKVVPEREDSASMTVDDNQQEQDGEGDLDADGEEEEE